MRKVALALAVILTSPTPVLAHSWYAQECCSGKDCQELPDGSVTEERYGYSVLSNQNYQTYFIPYGDKVIRYSKDIKYHLCQARTTFVVLCFYVPTPGVYYEPKSIRPLIWRTRFHHHASQSYF